MRRIDLTTLTTQATGQALRLGSRITRMVATINAGVRAATGRRAAVTLLAALTLTGIVRGLYASAEPPGALHGAPVAATRPTPTPAPPETPAQDQGPEGSATPAGPNGAPAPAPAPAPRSGQPTAPAGKPVKATPEEAAVAFYAAELGLPVERVRPLMQQRVNDHSVRVLVMAERGQEQLPTRLIQVNRTTSGWRVP
jgi:hypothetical protein